MAIEKDQLVELLNAEGDAEAKASKLMEFIGKDTTEQLNAVLMNKEQILVEKREEAAKRKAIEEQYNLSAKKIKEMEEQLRANSPDEVRKIYEAQLKDASNIHEQKVAEFSTLLEQKESEIKELRRSRLKLACVEQFNKAISGKNIASDAVADFSEYVLGVDCCKFESRPIGENQTVIATKEGQSIESAVKAALETSFGKRCVVVSSSGGGAEGGSQKEHVDYNPFNRDTFNLTKQAELYRTNKTLAEQLKAQAK